MVLLAPNQKITCINLPPRINSNGIWYDKDSPSVLSFSLPLLQLQILLIFFTTQTCHMILKHFKVPKIVSQLLAGVILGPSLLGRFETMKQVIFPIESQDILGTIATLGYTLFIFLIAVKMDMSMVLKIGKMPFVIGILTLLAPLILGPPAETLITKSFQQKDLPENFYIVRTSLALSPFADIFYLLTDLKILNSELGRIAVSAAMISDFGSLIVINIVTYIRVAKDCIDLALICIRGTIGLVLVAILIIRPILFWVIQQTPKGKPVKEIYINMTIVVVLVAGVVSHAIGHYIVFGPFIIGLAIPDGPPLGSAIVEKFEGVIGGIFLPLFVTTCAMRAEFATLMANNSVMIVVVTLIITTLVAKIGACVMASLCCKMPFNDSLALALIMSTKGLVELATYSFSRDNHNIDGEIYTILFIAVMMSIAATRILVLKLYGPSRKYGGYQKRNIINLRPNSELRILVCIQNPDDITSAINLVDASSPTPDTPINVSVLHLIKLVGRASPIFISHNIQIKSASQYSYSENVIPPFNEYQRYHPGAVSLNIFTAISPPDLMHEDICTLSLNKQTSFILLPFHINWCKDGSVASEDNNTRQLNCHMLERAPCSVGILVNRGQRRHTKSRNFNRIAMIFLGGNDDREALSYGKRMATKKDQNLTVVRLVGNDPKEIKTWEQMLDSDVLRDVKYNIENYRYKEEMVEDGAQMASILREMAHKYDLIVVGRSNSSDWLKRLGLSQWSEFPELGVIGDLLASSDFNGQASILVVQQQTILN